jgi:hypothetical protein
MKTYPRIIEDEIVQNLSNRKALLILGPRRSGKTTLIQRIREKIRSERTLYFDLEKHNTYLLLKSGIEHFISYLDDRGYSDTERVVVFIDEIQYLEEFSNFVKLAVDHYAHRLKLVLSGSSTAQIKFQFKDSLVGRKFLFHLYPLTFREYLVFKNENRICELLGKDYHTAQIESIRRAFNEKITSLYHEFLLYGGFPEVVLASSMRVKQRLLEEMIQAYVLKDIRNLFRIERITEFNHLIRILALQSGKQFNFGSIANEVKLDVRTLKKYLQILTDTYLIDALKPLFSNQQKELKKAPKIYMLDTGIRNMLINNFNPLEFRSDKGELLETGVFSELYKSLGLLDELHYWRTKDGKEVDFVIRKGVDYIPFEVKTRRASVNHLKRFGNLYNSSELNLISLEKPPGTVPSEIKVIPPWCL